MDNEETTSNETTTNTTTTSPTDPTTLFWTWYEGAIITHPRSEFRQLADEELIAKGDGIVAFNADGTPYILHEDGRKFQCSSMMHLSWETSVTTARDMKKVVLNMYEHIYRPTTPAARAFVARCF